MQKRSKRKIIRRIVKKRTHDGNFVPVEVTKTVIDKDGSRSITRENPEKYAAKMHRHNSEHHDSDDAFQGTINLTNQAAGFSTGEKSQKSLVDPYANLDYPGIGRANTGG